MIRALPCALLAAALLVGCGSTTDDETTTTDSPATEAATPAKTKASKSDDGGFRKWAKDNLGETAAVTLVKDAYVGGLATLHLKVSPSITDEKAKSVCTGALSWMTDDGYEAAERAVVESSASNPIAECNPGELTEIVR